MVAVSTETVLQHASLMPERQAAGKKLRDKVSRSDHARWVRSTDRRDPIDLLEESNRPRLPHLIPIRYGRMLVSPFAFLRGSALIMAHDLAATPTTGIYVQACGDAHLSNFGCYGTPERNLVFDVNDFDETLQAPWEWDIKRLAASVMVAGRHYGKTDVDNRQAVMACVRSYREHMHMFAEMGYLDVWYTRIDTADLLPLTRRKRRASIQHSLEKAHKQTILDVLPKVACESNGKLRIKDNPPLIEHLYEPDLEARLKGVVEDYMRSLGQELSFLLSRYRFLDIARKVVGVGSVGTRCFVALLQGSDAADPLLLQVKEAQESVLAPYAGPSPYANQGQRIVQGQRLIQAASDILLGWTRYEGRDFYFRQLRDMKLTAGPDMLVRERYAIICGWALARAHARSGDPALISGYLGKSDQFDRALASFAASYADQTERDYAALLAAVRSGRIQSVENPS